MTHRGITGSTAASRPWWCLFHLAETLPLVSLAAHRDGPRPVLVWLVAPSRAHEAAIDWLSADEAARLATMQHPRARAEFITGRWLIRGILGGLLGLAPEAVPLFEREAGSLGVDGPIPLVFNLSHTEGLVALAVAGEGELGVDVEWSERPGRTVELADRYFAPAEIAALRALPATPTAPAGAHQRARFFQLWTLKEAYIKARGLGLRIPLHSFSFDLKKLEPTITTIPLAGDSGDGWLFHEGPVGPGRHLALAWRPGGKGPAAG